MAAYSNKKNLTLLVLILKYLRYFSSFALARSQRLHEKILPIHNTQGLAQGKQARVVRLQYALSMPGAVKASAHSKDRYAVFYARPPTNTVGMRSA